MDVKTKSHVTIGPKTAAVGESFDLTPPLRVTLTDVTYRQGLYYKYSSGWDETETDLFSTTSDKTLALLHFDIENTGTESASFGPEPFTVSDGALHTDLRGASLSSALDVKGEPLNGTTVKAGQQISGWFLAQLSKKRAKKGAVVGWQRDIHKTTPERAWNVKPTKLPSFSLEQWTLDKEQPVGEYLNEITIKNTGETKGTFRGMVEYKIAAEGQNAWSPFEKINATLSPGKSKTFTLKKTWTYTETLNYRVRPFETTKKVDFTPPKLKFGEKTTIPHGTLQVNDLKIIQSYTKSNQNVPEKQKAKDDANYAFAYVKYIPTTDEYNKTNDSSNFSIRPKNKKTSNNSSPYYKIKSPFEGKYYMGGTYDMEPGEPQTGWISFEIPASISARDITIVFENDYGNQLTSSAEWSKK